MKDELEILLEKLKELPRYDATYNEKYECTEDFESDCGEYVKYEQLRPIMQKIESLLSKPPKHN